jgi:hypothetical protein
MTLGLLKAQKYGNHSLLPLLIGFGIFPAIYLAVEFFSWLKRQDQHTKVGFMMFGPFTVALILLVAAILYKTITGHPVF